MAEQRVRKDSLMEGQGQLSQAVRQRALKRLAALQREKDQYNWKKNARPEQLPPPGDWWTIWIFKGGRGSGKTRAGAEWCRDLVFNKGYRRGAIVGQTSSDVRDVCVEGPSGILSVCPGDQAPKYEPTRRRISFPNGAVIYVFSAEDPTRFRGPQFEFIWADEFVYYQNPQDLWDTMMLGLRLGKRPLLMGTTTPLPIPLMKDLIKREGKDVAITTSSTYANLDNLAPTFRQQILQKYEGTSLGKQEVMGELLFEVEGALWKSNMFQYIRNDEVPDLQRVAVAVDPSVTKNRRSDEAGIIAGGIDFDGRGYITHDRSRKATPQEWAQEAVNLYHTVQADILIAEKNQGGEMVKNTIHSVDPGVNVKLISAYRGKLLRAEPVSAKYEQHKVYHVPGMDQLEAEMCTYDGTGKSPNRLDGAVYLLQELMIRGQSRIRWEIF